METVSLGPDATLEFAGDLEEQPVLSVVVVLPPGRSPHHHPLTLPVAAAGLRTCAVEMDVSGQLAGPVNKPYHKDENDKESKDAQEALRRASSS
ncbi:hypothetical protein LEMLEM_LOCUS10394 [Lemmus lemmus]